MSILLPSITKSITKSLIIEGIKIILWLKSTKILLANLTFQKAIITHLEL